MLALFQIYRALRRRGGNDIREAVTLAESPQKMVVLFRDISRRLGILVLVLDLHARFSE